MSNIARTLGGKVTEGGSVYGSYTEYTESESQSTTVSATPQAKVSLTTPSLDSGNYKIAWYSETNNSAGFFGQVGVQVDYSATLIGDTVEESENSSTWQGRSGFKVVNLSGVHTISIKFYRAGGAGTASIRSARIEITRVS